MKKQQLILTREDFTFLAERFLSEELSAFNKARLEEELQAAKVVQKEWLPANVVCTNASVLVTNLDKSQTFNVHILPLGTQSTRVNDLRVDDPLSVALLGYQSGGIAEWELDNGVNRFQIVSVHQKDADSLPAHSVV